jgi:chromosome segregation ATPase
VTNNNPINSNNRKNNIQTTQKFSNPIAYLKDNQTNNSLTTVLQAIHTLGDEIASIKKLLTDMDNRISNIETDAYWYHTTKDEDQVIITEYPPTGPERSQTPPSQTETIEDSFSNYQRKRQALSPADDLRAQQHQLHHRIDTMGNTLEQVASTLNEFTAELFTSAGPSNEFTMSAEQLNESIFGDQTPTEDTQ